MRHFARFLRGIVLDERTDRNFILSPFAFQITVCSTPGGVCVNDLDSPAGEGRTICRQIFKTEKLLALDESG